ncbi:hypothetical protein PybrP1_011426 [[Pythium] brassicae (nom. inval.)]|nr:hypothetical protein PybrP1_011426 [[Pythium] brassicae (nom. inval.)]
MPIRLRGGRRSVALAATASLRALPLRRVLLTIVAVFVLLPLLVFNVATRDGAAAAAYASAFLRTRTPVAARPPPFPNASLPNCLNTSLLATDLARVASECTSGAAREPAESLVHFVHVALDEVAPETAAAAPERVTFLQYAAVQSVRALVRPSLMLLHYVEHVPRGVWYTQVQRHLSLHKVLAPDVSGAAASLDARRRRQLMAFVLMLRALHKQGGIAFSDFNTFVLRDTLQHTGRLGAVVAGQASPRPAAPGAGGGFRVSVHALQAPAKHPLLKFLELELLALAARDDPALRAQPLEQLVGQLVLDQYTRAPSDGAAAATAANVIVGPAALFEGISLAQLPSLLRARVGDAPRFFRGVTAFHVDRFDFARNRSDTEALTAVHGLETLSAEDALEGDALARALLRFAAGLNTTAELDAHLAR